MGRDMGNRRMTKIAIIAGRGDPSTGTVSKVFPAACKGCSAMACCDGFEPHYIARHGDSEVVPYLGDNRSDPRFPVLDRERVQYRAAHFVKLKPDADVKRAVKQALKPVPISAKPLVSVVITNYNYSQYLGACLDSVIAQTYDKVELVVVDDLSTDNSEEVIQSYDHAIDRVVWMPGHEGQPAPCRNRGIEEASGELIVSLDADDMIMPTYIEEAVRTFRRHPEASLVYPSTQCFGDSEQRWAAPPWDYGTLIHHNFVVCSSMFRRSMWADVGGYATNVRGIEDFALWVKAAGLGHIGVPLPRQLFCYRVHPNGIFQTDVVPNHDAKYAQMVRDLWYLYPPSMVRQARNGEKIERCIE